MMMRRCFPLITVLFVLCVGPCHTTKFFIIKKSSHHISHIITTTTTTIKHAWWKKKIIYSTAETSLSQCLRYLFYGWVTTIYHQSSLIISIDPNSQRHRRRFEAFWSLPTCLLTLQYNGLSTPKRACSREGWDFQYCNAHDCPWRSQV